MGAEKKSGLSELRAVFCCCNLSGIDIFLIIAGSSVGCCLGTCYVSDGEWITGLSGSEDAV